MNFKINIYLILNVLWLYANIIYSQSVCNIVVNGKNYNEKKMLYVDKKYDLLFGMMLNKTDNNVIAFAFDAECMHSNTFSKSKWFYSLDLDDKIIEINALNCPENFFLQNFSLKQSSKINFLSFKFDLKENKFQNLFDLTVKLSLNRRLGKGCSSTVTFHRNINLAIVDYYDYESPNFRSSFEMFWNKIISNWLYFLVLIIIFLIFMIFFSCLFFYLTKKFRSFPISRNNFEFRNLSESRNQMVDLEQIDENNQKKTTINVQKTPEVKSDGNSANEFQILRNKLLNKENSYKNENGLESDISKNIIFQN